MGLLKITFDGSSVTSKQDADFNYHAGDLIKAGIMESLGSGVTCSAANNYINFTDGYVMIYGRRIYVESGTSVYISLDSTKYGYVCVTVNLATNSVTLEKIETTGTYPTLTQENLQNGGSKYQFAIARYTKTTTALTLDTSYSPTKIKSCGTSISEGVQEAKDYADNKYKMWSSSPSYQSGKYYYFPNINKSILEKSVVVVHVLNQYLAVAGIDIGNNTSMTSAIYFVGATPYVMSLEYLPETNQIVIGVSEATHNVKTINCYR